MQHGKTSALGLPGKVYHLVCFVGQLEHLFAFKQISLCSLVQMIACVLMQPFGFS